MAFSFLQKIRDRIEEDAFKNEIYSAKSAHISLKTLEKYGNPFVYGDSNYGIGGLNFTQKIYYSIYTNNYFNLTHINF